jgi:hypothetical protein
MENLKPSRLTAHEAIIQNIIRIAPYMNIHHHVPGRIRLKTNPAFLAAIRGIDFDNMIRSIPGVLDHRVNLPARSVVIEYDPRRLPYALWESVGHIRHNPGIVAQVTDQMRTLWAGEVGN